MLISEFINLAPEELGRLVELELGLMETTFPEQVTEKLIQCTQLTGLDLSYKHFGKNPESARIIAEALPQIPQLATLNLKVNYLGKNPEVARIIAEALPQIPQLATLDLLGNGLGENPESARIIAEALPQIPQLATLVLVANCFGKNPESTRIIADALSRMLQLTTLNLGAMGYLLENPESARFFADALSRMPQLTTLSWYKSHLGKNPEVARIIAEALPQIPQLATLNLGANYLGQNPESARFFADALSRMPQLTTLYLRVNDLGKNPESARIIADALSRMPQLTTLDLGANDLGKNPESARIIADALSRMPQLTVLDLGANDLCNWDEATWKQWGDVIENHPTLHELYLERNGLSFLPAEQKSIILQYCPSLAPVVNGKCDKVIFHRPTAELLLTAAAEGDVNAIQSLLNQGMSPNVTADSGFTPTLIASQAGHFDAAIPLLESEQEAEVASFIQKQQELENDIASLRAELEETKEATEESGVAIDAMMRKLDILMEERKRLEQKKEAESYVLNTPRLKHFHNHLLARLTGLFLAYQTLASNLVSRAETNTDNLVHAFMNIAGNTIPIFGGVIAEGLNQGYDYIRDRQEDEIWQRLIHFFPDLETIQIQTKVMARLTTFKLEPLLLKLADDKTASDFAECIVGRCLSTLQSNHLDKDVPLFIQLLYSLFKEEPENIFMLARETPLMTNTPVNPPWSVESVLSQSILVTPEGLCFAPDGCSDQSYIAWRLGTTIEAQGLGYHNIPAMDTLIQEVITGHPLRDNLFRYEEPGISQAAPKQRPSAVHLGLFGANQNQQPQNAPVHLTSCCSVS